MRKRVGKIASLSWRVALVGIFTATILWGLYGFRLRVLSPGISEAEQQTVQTRQSLSMVLNQPQNAPYNATQLLLQKINKRTVFINRILSAAIASAAIISFFGLIVHIATKRIALFGTLLFASSSFSLHIGRSGTVDVLPYLFIVFLAGCAHLVFGNKMQKTVLIIVLLCFGNLLYVPGMIWLLAPLLIWQIKRVLNVVQDQPLWYILSFVGLGVLLILPLLWGSIANPKSLMDLMLIPKSLPNIKTFVVNLSLPFQQLFFRRDISPANWLSPTSILDAVTTILSMLGLYAISFQKKLDRFWLLVISFLIISVFSGLGSLALLPIFVALMFVVITLGLALIFQQWKTVFPKNPFIKWITLGLSLGLVTISLCYQTTRYFKAWANSPATKKAMLITKP